MIRMKNFGEEALGLGVSWFMDMLCRLWGGFIYTAYMLQQRRMDCGGRDCKENCRIDGSGLEEVIERYYR